MVATGEAGIMTSMFKDVGKNKVFSPVFLNWFGMGTHYHFTQGCQVCGYASELGGFLAFLLAILSLFLDKKYYFVRQIITYPKIRAVFSVREGEKGDLASSQWL